MAEWKQLSFAYMALCFGEMDLRVVFEELESHFEQSFDEVRAMEKDRLSLVDFRDQFYELFKEATIRGVVEGFSSPVLGFENAESQHRIELCKINFKHVRVLGQFSS